MLTIKKVELKLPYGTDSHELTATIGYGDYSHQTFELELDQDRVKRVLAMIRMEVGGQLGKVSMDGDEEEDAAPAAPAFLAEELPPAASPPSAFDAEDDGSVPF